MKNYAMRFLDFTWPANPSFIELRNSKNLKQLNLPGKGFVVQNLGHSPRTVVGEGVFCGSKAKEYFFGLQKLFLKNLPGILFVPGIEPFEAYMKELKVTSKESDSIIEYKFTFIECEKKQINAQANVKKYYTLREGESLWNVSAAFNIPVETLLALNKNCMEPWDTAEGERVRIC